jgi:hypothetical protein
MAFGSPDDHRRFYTSDFVLFSSVLREESLTFHYFKTVNQSYSIICSFTLGFKTRLFKITSYFIAVNITAMQ